MLWKETQNTEILLNSWSYVLTCSGRLQGSTRGKPILNPTKDWCTAGHESAGGEVSTAWDSQMKLCKKIWIRPRKPCKSLKQQSRPDERWSRKMFLSISRIRPWKKKFRSCRKRFRKGKESWNNRTWQESLERKVVNTPQEKESLHQKTQALEDQLCKVNEQLCHSEEAIGRKEEKSLNSKNSEKNLRAWKKNLVLFKKKTTHKTQALEDQICKVNTELFNTEEAIEKDEFIQIMKGDFQSFQGKGPERTSSGAAERGSE